MNLPRPAINFVVTAPVAAGLTVFAWRLGIFWKPWRAEEAGVMLALAIPAGLLISWLVSSRHRWFRLWCLGLVLGWLVALTISVRLYRHHQRLWLPSLASAPGALGLEATLVLAGAAIDSSEPLLPVHSFPVKAPDPVRTADSILANLREEMRWREAGSDHPTWVLRRHALMATDPLLDAFRTTGDLRYLNAAERMVFTWINGNSGYLFAPPSRFSWNDHATALRMTRLLAFLQAWDGSPRSTRPRRTRLLRSIVGHARTLADSAFYTARHNHGVDQDLALLQAAVLLPHLPESPAWFHTASNRLRHTLEELISPRGVFKEHSPGYHFTSLVHLAYFSDFLQRAGRASELSWLQPLVEHMAGFLAHFVEPDGTLVSFGDTAVGADLRSHPVAQQLATRHRQLRAVLADGPEGESVPALQFFPDDGYLFLREPGRTSRTAEDAWYVAVTAASNRRFVHKHCDGLSVVVSGLGRHLLIDPGLYGYSEDNWRRYFVSCEAHNTIAIGMSQDTIATFPVGNGNSMLDQVRDAGSVILVTGQQTLGQFHHHRRAILWIRDHGMIVIDLVTAQGSGNGASRPSASDSWPRQFFHFGPAVEVQLVGKNRAELYDRGSRARIGSARQHLIPARWEKRRGSTDPLLGWQAVGSQHAIPVDALVASHDSVAGTFVTELILTPSALASPDPRASVQEVRVVSDTIEIGLLAGSSRWRARVVPEGASLAVSR